MVAGVRDLHQTNMMISGGQPYMTDVEIAFDQDLLATIHTEIQAGAAFHAAQTTPLTLADMQLTNMWDKGLENVRLATKFAVVDDLLVTPRRDVNLHVPEPVTENLLAVEGVGANRCLGKPGNQKTNVHQVFAPDVAQGFRQMMQAIGEDEPARQRILAFIDSVEDLHVRYHPIATGQQLSILQHAQMNIIHEQPQINQTDQAINARCAANVYTKLGLVNQREARLQVPLEATQQAMEADLQRGDVPYFTRRLDNNALYHNGTEAIEVDFESGIQGVREGFSVRIHSIWPAKTSRRSGKETTSRMSWQTLRIAIRRMCPDWACLLCLTTS